MKITGISQYKGKTLQIDFDGGEPIFIHADIAFEYHLKEGQSVPQSAVEQIIKANDTRRAKARALYLLDVRDYGYVELFKKLEVSYSEDICFEVCNYLAGVGLINDVRYAEKLAEHLCVTKKYGYYRAREQMKLKGLTDEVIGNALEPYREDTCDRIKEVIEKKYHRYLGDEKGIDKTKAALVRLGYSYGEVNRAVKEYIEELESEE